MFCKLLWVLTFFAPAAQAQTSTVGGTIVTDGFVSKFVPRSPTAPEGDPRRLFNVYLPPDFFNDPTATFPIVYHLTGFGGDFTTYSASDKAAMDMMLATGQIVPLIIVAPDPSVLIYEDNFYVNSTLTGLFENYIVQELIPYVDAKYRQRKTASGESRFFRALMGQSMGGYGSLYYGIKHPELFISFCGDSSTSFWLIVTNLASPPAPGFPDGNPMYTFNQLLIPELANNPQGKINPANGDNTFGFFAWAASFSPNPARPFLVDYPFVVDSNSVPELVTTPSGPSFVPVQSVINLWQTFDPYVLLDTANKDTLRRQAIYLDAGANTTDEIIDNVGARFFQDKLISLNINNEYLLFEGGHTTCTTIQELNCYRFTTNLKIFSGKFSEAGIFAPDVRVTIVGNQTIELTDSAVMSINNKKLVGVETAPALGVTETNVTFLITDNARLEIGNASTIGGALQVGNAFGKANLLFDPSLLTNTISCTFELNGPGATLQIGRQGYLGCGVGIDGNQTALPNFWGVSSLANVASVNFNFLAGNFLHNQIASSLDPKSALFALGNCIDRDTSFSFTFNPATVLISGGANLAEITLANLLHPTVQDTAGPIPPGGIRSMQVFAQGLFDTFYGPPKGMISSQTIYTNTLTVGIMASSLMLLDTQKTPLPNPATADQLFNYLEVVDYLDQGTKRATINILDGQLTVGYEVQGTAGTELIERPVISTGVCTPLSQNFNAAKIIQEGAVGIKLVTINGEKVILRLYDLNPTV